MKKNIKNIIYAILGYVSIALFLDLRYEFIISLLFFILTYFFIKTDIIVDKKNKNISLFIAILISLIMGIGQRVSLFKWSTPVKIFSTRNIIYSLIVCVGLFLIIYRFMVVFLKNIKNVNIFNDAKKLKMKKFLVLWIVMFICWLPYFLRFYPAIMTSDSYYVLHYANNFILSDLHTFGHTWFFGAFFYLGKWLTGSLMFGVGLSTVVQMLILSYIFTYLIKQLYELGLNKIICLLIFLNYAISPLHAHYSITLWRDILFGGIFVTLSLCLFNYIKNNYTFEVGEIIIFAFSIVIMLFFRNNGIYIFIIALLLLMLICKYNRLFTGIIGISIIFLYFFIKGPVFNYFNIAKTKSIEAYSIPLQQIARAVTIDNNLSNVENETLSKFINVELISQKYSPVISDPIKNISNGDNISSNISEFVKIWGHLLLKHPQAYIEAYLMQTLGYWYPTVEYWATGSVSKPRLSENVGTHSLTPNIINKVIDNTSSRKLPFSNFIWSIGTMVIFYILSLAILFYRKNQKYILAYIPCFSLWLSIMLSTPVFSELRYVYGLFCTIPLLIVIPFYNEVNKRGNKKGEIK